jgi:hypothetical protein
MKNILKVLGIVLISRWLVNQPHDAAVVLGVMLLVFLAILTLEVVTRIRRKINAKINPTNDRPAGDR